jgi:hypothetical protein
MALFRRVTRGVIGGGATARRPGTAFGREAPVIALLVIAAAVVSAPIVAALLVTLGSLREDSGRTLNGRAPNWVAAIARRVLSVRFSGGVTQPPAWTPPRPRASDEYDATRPLTGPRA